MRKAIGILFVFVVLLLASCDLRSGTAKEEMEKLEPSPTPVFLPPPVSTPTDPADAVTVNVDQDGPVLFVNGYKLKTTTNCTKFNRVMVSGDDNTVVVKGVCKQVMLNGDRNTLTSDAAVEFVLNGTENVVKYGRYANGKVPLIVENKPGNTVQKTTAAAVTSKAPERKIEK